MPSTYGGQMKLQTTIPSLFLIALALGISQTTTPVAHFPTPSPGKPGEVVPMARFRPANNNPYKPTAEEKQQITIKTDQLGSLIRTLRDRREDDALLADVEIFHSAAKWIMEFPDEFFNQASAASTLSVLDEGMERARQMQQGKRPWVAAKEIGRASCRERG